MMTLPRVFSALLAALVAALVFAMTVRTGDPQATIAQAERAISGVAARHTFQLKDAAARRPDDGSRSLYRMAGAKGELLFLEGPAARDRKEVEDIFAKLYNSGGVRYMAQDSALSDLSREASRLVPQNKKVAQAKGLLRFESKPAALSEDVWRERLPDSITQWQVQELDAFQRQRASYAAAAAIGAFAFFLLAFKVVGNLSRRIRLPVGCDPMPGAQRRLLHEPQR